MIMRKVRRQIRVCNSYKAELIANKEYYETEYYTKQLSEYNTFILKKEREIENRQATVRWSTAVIGVLMLLILPIFLRPAFTGLIVENVTIRPENLSFNLTEINVTEFNVSIVNDTNVTEINESIVANDTNVTEINDSGANITQNATLIGVKLNETEIIMVNTTNMILNESLNITENVTENLTGPINATGNLTEPIVEPDNITEPVITEPVVEEPVVEPELPINLAPRGALPPQFMEPNMAIALNLSEYFGDPENDSLRYTVDEHASFDVSIDLDVLTIVSNDTGQHLVIVFVTDGLNNNAAAMDVRVEAFKNLTIPANVTNQTIPENISAAGPIEYVEMLVKTSDNIHSKKPKSQWTEEMFAEERAASAKQGYIVMVKPEGWNWGSLERDPKRFAILKIPKSEFNESWLEPEYDYDNPRIRSNGIPSYPVKTMRKFRLPLEAIVESEELDRLKALPYNAKEKQPEITKAVLNVGSLIEEMDYNKLHKNYTDYKKSEIRIASASIEKQDEWVSHGSAGTFRICTQGSPPCNYSSLSAWEAGEQADLTGNGPCIANITDTWATADTTYIVINGWTTTGVDYIKIVTDPSARHPGQWSTTAYRLNVTQNDGAIQAHEDNMIIEGLQIFNNDSNNDQGIHWQDGANLTFSHNIMTGYGGNPDGENCGYIDSWNANIQKAVVYNNIAYGKYKGFCFGTSSNASYYAYSNTAANNTLYGFEWDLYDDAALANISFTNNLACGNGNADYYYDGADATAYYKTNLACDTTSPNNEFDSQTVEFVDNVNFDFHLIADNDAARGNGTDLSADGNYSFSDDIDGETRSDWDIGADEYVEPCVNLTDSSTYNGKLTSLFNRSYHINDNLTLCSGIYNTDTIFNYIIINKTDITLDCDGSELVGSGLGTGLLSTKNNTVVQNCIFTNFGTGINICDTNESDVPTTNWNWTQDPSGSDEFAFSVAVDADGNYIVFGYDIQSSSPQWRAVKVSSSGAVLWNWTQNASSAEDYKQSVAVDASGNYILAGFDGQPPDLMMHVVKVSSSGVTIWNWTQNPSTSFDAILSVTADADGNYIVAGYEFQAGTKWRVVKINSSGSTIWNWTESPSFWDVAFSVAVDADSNYIVAGADFLPGHNQMRVVKINSSGSTIWNWTQDTGTNSGVRSVAVDADGNYIVAGYDRQPGNDQWRVVKINRSGSTIWNWTQNASSSLDIAYSVAVDSDGNYIVAGYDQSPGDDQWRVVKISNSGSTIWNWTQNPSGSTDNAYSVAVDSDGNYIVAGRDNQSGDYQWRVVKLSPDKEVLSTGIYNTSVYKENHSTYLAINATTTIENLTLGYNSTVGKINWESILTNGTSLGSNRNIILNPNFVSLTGFNYSANVTIEKNSTCSGLSYYQISGFPETQAAILAGASFTPSYTSCSDSTDITTFSVDGFSGYSTQGAASPCLASGDYNLTTTATCSDTTITFGRLNISSNGFFNFDNVTLVVDDFIVEEGGKFQFVDSKNTMWVNGNWTISGFVNITNSTVRMNGTSDGHVGINVTSTGWLIINETANITNGDQSNAEFFFLVQAGSNFSMEDSYLTECGWGSSVGERGLEVFTTMDTFRGNSITNGYYGMVLHSDDNVLEDSIFNDNSYNGFRLDTNANNTFINVSFNSNWDVGIRLQGSSNNTFINNSFIGNDDGLRIILDSFGNNLTGSVIANTEIGIAVSAGSGPDPRQNFIYNNIFNNSRNLVISDAIADENYLNISGVSATNIIDGNYIGGNYWTNSTGDGFSDVCTDLVTPYGICDDYYNLSNGTSVAIDWLPLSTGYSGSCDVFCVNCSNCTAEIENAAAGETVCLADNVTNQDGDCIVFNGASDITFTCNGHYLDGDGDSTGRGIWFNTSNDGSNNTVVRDCNITEFGSGISLNAGTNNTFINHTLSGNDGTGFYADSTTFNTLLDIDATGNEKGLYLRAQQTLVANSAFVENTDVDIYMHADSAPTCDVEFSNITVSGSYNFSFHNDTVNLADEIYSLLILCDADGSTLDNITIIGSTTLDNNGLALANCDDTVVSNINSSNNYNGIDLNANIGNNTIENVIVKDNALAGIFLDRSENDTFTNITASGNAHGIRIISHSMYNTFNDSWLSDNTYGVSIGITSYNPVNNTFYNIFFNNTQNVYSDDVDNANWWNISRTLGTNIVGGPYVGGNYYTDSDGNFSDTCFDNDNDFICDIQFNLTDNNTDFLPLLNNDAPSITLHSPPNASSTTENYVILNATVTDPDNQSVDTNIYGYYADEIDSTETGLWNQLAALYHLNNDSSAGENDSHVYDWSGNSHNGTPNDNAIYTSSGKLKGSYSFDGAGSDRITCENFNFSADNFSISAWIKIEDGDQAMIVTRSGNNFAAGDTGVRFQMQATGTVQLHISNGTVGSDGWVSSTNTVNDGEWHHVVAVRKGTEAHIYIDTAKDSDLSMPSGSCDYEDYLTIGGSTSGVRIFNGSIDEVAIWNRSLTDQEVNILYDKGRDKLLYTNKSVANGTEINYNLTTMPLSVQDDMVLLMHFDNDSAYGENDSHVYDWTGLGNNGTANNDSHINYSGKFGGAIDLDGTEDYYTIPDNNYMNFENNSFAISTWFKTDSTSDRSFIANEVGGYTSGYAMKTWNYMSGFVGGGSQAQSIYIDTSANVNDDEWHMGTFTVDWTNYIAKLYIDGQKAAIVKHGSSCGVIVNDDLNFSACNQVNASSTSDIYIGKNGFDANSIKALIDELAIWNKSLSASEIQALYELQAGRYYWYGNVTDGELSDTSDTWWFEVNASSVPDLRITNNIAYTNTTLECEINTSDTIDVSWFADDAVVKQNSSVSCSGTCYQYLEWNYTHHDNDIICGVSNANSSSLTISNYSTSLAVENGSDSPVNNQNVWFYANYSNSDFGDIKRVLWESGVINVWSIRFVDSDKDGVKESFYAGNAGSTRLKLFNPDFTLNWSLDSGISNADKLYLMDLDNDGYKTDVLFTGRNRISIVNITKNITLYTPDQGSNIGDAVITNLDNGPFANDFVIGLNNGTIRAFNSSNSKNWSVLWNSNNNTEIVTQIISMDRSGDSIDDTIAFVGNHVYFLNYSGSLIKNVSIDWNRGSIASGDIMGNSSEEVFASSDGESILIDSNLDINWSVAYRSDEIYFEDLAENGTSYIVMAGSNSNPTHSRVLDYQGNTISNLSLTTENNVLIVDIDDTKGLEILSGNDAGTFIVNNYTGNTLWSRDYEGVIGIWWSNNGYRPAMDYGDVNLDGVPEIGFVNTITADNGQIVIVQDVRCVAEFNDSSSYDMVWNYSIGKFQVNKSFTSAGTYDYNITCEKGGYSTQFSASEITVEPAPVVQEVNITPYDGSAYTNSTLRCYANITSGTSATFNADFEWYLPNGSLWDSETVLVSNNSINYSMINVTWNETHHDDDWMCRVRGLTGNWSNVSRTIGNYSTSLALQNETDSPVTDQMVNFYANYSRTEDSIPGLGKELGRLVWKNTLDADVQSVAAFDCGTTGRKGCIASVLMSPSSNEVQVFWGNGTGKYNFSYNQHHYVVVAGDMNNDSYNNEFVASDAWQVSWFNTTERFGYVDYDSATDNANAVALVDINNDSIPEIVYSTENNELFVYYINESQAWNYTGLSARVEEIESADINKDGIPDIVVSTYYGNITVLNGSDGALIWETSAIGARSVSLIDLDKDGKTDEIIAGRTYHTFFNESGDQLYDYNGPGGFNIHDIAVGDFDGDGFINEFVTLEQTEVQVLSCNLTACVPLWSTNTSCTQPTYNIFATDFDDDGLIDIVVTGNSNYTCALTNNGTLSFEYQTNEGIDNSNGNSPLVDAGDLTGDGIKEIIFGSKDDSIYVAREVNCIASFSDYIYNMTWNDTARRWQMNRTFSTSGTYDYNVTCEKGGYETTVTTSEVTVEPAPVVQEVNISPFIAYTNSTLRCYANITSTTSATFNADFEWYQPNGSLWNSETILVSNNSINYSSINVTWNNTYHDHDWMCRVRGLTGNWSNVSRTVSNYSTSLSMQNSTDSPVNNQMVWFYGNYSAGFPVSGYGLNNYEIGGIIWNTTNFGQEVFTTTIMDLDSDGILNHVVFGTDGHVTNGEVFIYFSNGSLNASIDPDADPYNMHPADLDGDNFYNDLVIGRNNGNGLAYLQNLSLAIQTSPMQSHAILVYDINGDGDDDVIWANGEDTYIEARYSNGSLAWNHTQDNLVPNNVVKIMAVQLNSSTSDPEIVAIGGGDQQIMVYHLNGTKINNFSLGSGSRYDAELADLNQSGTKDFLVTTYDAGSFIVLDSLLNLKQQIFFPTMSDTINSLIVLDYDGDGYEDDIVIEQDQFVHAFNMSNESYDQIKNYSVGEEITLLMRHTINDNDDAIIVTTASGRLIALNLTLDPIFEINLSSRIGGFNAKTPIAFADINDDGIFDVSVATYGGFGFVVQEVSCTAEFNDSTIYNMTWNHSVRKWQVNRTFPFGNYSYNMTCSKSGYETAFASSEILVASNQYPSINVLNISPDTPYTNSTLQCYFNITDAEDNNATVWNVEWLNYNGTWNLEATESISINDSNRGEIINASNVIMWNQTNHDDDWMCRIRLQDQFGRWGNYSNVTRGIGNYSTSLVVANETDSPVTDQMVSFYANYTAGFNMSGIGFTRDEIGVVIWNTSDLGTTPRSIASFDYENDGSRDDYVMGLRGSLRGIYSNGSVIWTDSPGQRDIYNIQVGDFDNDSYFDDFVTLDEDGYVMVYNKSGDVIWSNGSYWGTGDIDIGDSDGSGVNNDIYVFADRILLFNSSDGITWTNSWNASFNDTADKEIKVTVDIDGDGIKDIIANGRNEQKIGVFSGRNLTLLFNVSLPERPSSVGFGDLDHDGVKDEIVVSILNNAYIFEWNSVYGSEYVIGDALFSIATSTAYTYETIVDDLDSDGYYDDIILGDRDYLEIYNNDTLAGQYSDASLDNVYSMTTADVLDDGSRVIVASSNSGKMFFFNRTAGVLMYYNIDKGEIGYPHGHEAALAVTDSNKDGIYDIAIATEDGYAYLMQYAACIASFNDSTSYNMTWNSTARRWEMNRTFSTGGTYDYNVTCEKGGYETVLESSDIQVQEQTCGYINDDTTLYTDLTVNGTCFIFNTSNVTLDCDGFTITGNETGIGVLANYSDNITIKDCIITNFTDGIFLNFTNSSLVENNTVYDVQDDGMEMYYSNNNTFQLNNLTAPEAYNSVSMYMAESNYNLIFNNTLYTGENSIQIYDSEMNNITQNTLVKTSQELKAFFLRHMDNAGHSNNSIDTSNTIDGRPIYYFSYNNYNPSLQCPASFGNVTGSHLELAYCTNVSLSNITLIGDSFTLDMSSSINVTDLSVANASSGIFMYDSHTITVDRFSLDSITYGYYLWAQSHGNIIKNGFINSTNYGLRLSHEDYNSSFINVTVYSNRAVRLDYGDKTNISIINSSLYGTDYDIALNGGQIGELILVNTSFNKSTASVESPRNLTVQYYLRAQVIDETSAGISGATVNISNNNSLTITDTTTDANGYTSWYIVTEYTHNSSQDYDARNVTFFTPHHVNASYLIFTNSTSATINYSQTVVLGMETTIYCYNCTDCSQKIAIASSGDTIYLAANITNSTTPHCINVSTNNITFDGQGNNIDGKDTEDYGIYLYRSADTITNVTIRNVVVSDWDEANIYLYQSQGNNLSNIVSTSSNLIGLYLGYSGDNKVKNASLQDNYQYDMLVRGSGSECDNVIENITGTGGLPIEYYNSSTVIENKILSELELCDADGSTINNVTIMGSANNMLHLEYSDDCVITDVNSSDNYHGIYIYSSDNTSIYNSTMNNNQDWGLRLSYSDGGRYDNLTTFNNADGLRVFLSEDNNFSRIKARDNDYGVILMGYDNNNLYDSIIENNSVYGVRFWDYSPYVPENHSIYNNIFNNTLNIVVDNTTVVNFWNTSKTLGTNIWGGEYLGGNFWTNPTGTGWSDNCTDTDGDGLCNQQYNITANNTDYLPIAISSNNPPDVNHVNITPGTATTNSTLRCYVNATDAESAILNATFEWLQPNGSVWQSEIIEISNNSINYSSINVTWNYTHHDDDWMCRVRAYDNSVYSNYSNISRTISNHTTSLSAQNSTDTPIQDQMVWFYANYTAGFGVSEVGLTRKELGFIIWNTSDLGTSHSSEFFDYDNDSILDAVAVGLNPTIDAYLMNGSQISGFSSFVNGANEIKRFGDRLLTHDDNNLVVFLTNGSYLWNYSTGSYYMTANYGDFDGNGYDDIVASYWSGSEWSIVVFNSSDNRNWSLYWLNNTGTDEWGSEIREIMVADLNQDSKDDIITMSENGTIWAFSGNGSLLWKNLTGDYIGTLTTFDHDKDGTLDEIATSSGSTVVAHNESGDGLWLQSGPYGRSYEIESADLDGDGFNDEIVMAERLYGYPVNIIFALDNDGTILWNTTTYKQNETYNGIGSLMAHDINDDGLDDVIAGDMIGSIWLLNNSGKVLATHNFTNGQVGAQEYGDNLALDAADVNNDGIADISAATYGGHLYIVQEVACTLDFTDASYNMTWNNSARRWETNRSFSSSGLKSYNITCQKGGYDSQIKLSQIQVGANTAPKINAINITPNNTAYRNTSFNCSVHIEDNQSANINVNFTWFVNDTTNSSWDTTLLCANNTWCFTDNYPTDVRKHYNITCSARALDGSLNSDWANSTTVTISNFIPLAVNLSRPLQNQTIITRAPFFNWTQSLDADQETIYYNLLVDDTVGFDFPEINITTTELNYTSTIDLGFGDYYWIVKPYDNESWGSNSTKFNFTLISSVVISLPNNTIDFGTLGLNDSNSTADEDPYPFVVQNDGNTYLDVWINSSALWESVAMDLEYYQTKVNLSNETGAFNWSDSQITWANMTNGTKIIDYLNYTDTNDSAKVDIGVLVPPNEPSGTKQATVTIYAWQS